MSLNFEDNDASKFEKKKVKKSTKVNKLPKALKSADSYLKCEDKSFRFKSTKSLKTTSDVIFQKRATQAIELGLSIRSPGYNIYVAGVQGTGKASVIKEFLSKWSDDSQPPCDWVYLNNFHEKEKPIVVRLDNGKGIVFKKQISQLLKNLKEEITFTLHSEDYENVVNAHLSSSNERKAALFSELEKHAKGMDFAIKSSQLGIETVPIVNGKTISDKEYYKLSIEKKEKIEKKRAHLEPEVLDFARKVRVIENESKSYIESLRRSLGDKIVSGLMEGLIEDNEDHKKLSKYLLDFKEDVIENMLDFVEDDEEDEESHQENKKDILLKYKVNLFIDNSTVSGAPVIIEANPSYYNIFGKVEKHIEHGVYQTDFHSIKAGSIHSANGGYLVLNALDIFKTHNIWDTLKKTLRNRMSFIEDYGEHLSLLPTSGLRPESIPLELKVILIGNDEIYRILYQEDEDFTKIFKIKAEFDYKMPRVQKNINHLASFIATRARKENLLHLDKSALSTVVEFGSRLVEDQKYITTQFALIKDLIIEADFFAKKRKAKLITRSDIERALDHQYFRLSLREDLTLEQYKSEDILVSLEGANIGQVNGLAVYDYGDFCYGKVGRITCTTSISDSGIINVERASRLSGRIHDKGMYILTAYLNAILAREKKMGISASVCFEQNYGLIDGDSASAAELVSIISALAKIPIKQNFAITGSINQMGEIQPVGGINEKIEGFLKLCKMRGKSSKFGVIIPKSNVRNLMLNREAREEVHKGNLKIYPVGFFWEAFEILTEVPLGVKDIYKPIKPAPNTAIDEIDRKIKKLGSNNTLIDDENKVTSINPKKAKKLPIAAATPR